ncbi:hypothetical protein [Terrihabitans rhizophilus]|jgi:hypothetical protein|uniref:Uncharacterized protein n=1 Tax=Terrihabitans rhizophilus TaxID=3092662 RepID=A0ABU4RMU4_9HYPH|nr:hypothetical protein [Terrihabitans sp. PJ23]MDX6805045.1 hypothetical protein [Terrihabitans sp. PJ23]
MGHYVMKNLQVDLVDNTASVCIACDGGKGPSVINMKFPLQISGAASEIELREHARNKVRLVLTRALESVSEHA